MTFSSMGMGSGRRPEVGRKPMVSPMSSMVIALYRRMLFRFSQTRGYMKRSWAWMIR